MSRAHASSRVEPHSFVVVLMGVAGTGKTTVGKLLAAELGATFCDADDLHTAANIEKMSQGEALDDVDRWPWLARVRARIDEAVAHGEALVVACSALKRSYRQRLQQEGANDPVRVVYLRGSKAIIAERLRARTNHFMPAALIDSQCEALEEPSTDDAFIVDITESPGGMVARIRRWLDTSRRAGYDPLPHGQSQSLGSLGTPSGFAPGGG